MIIVDISIFYLTSLLNFNSLQMILNCLYQSLRDSVEWTPSQNEGSFELFDRIDKLPQLVTTSISQVIQAGFEWCYEVGLSGIAFLPGPGPRFRRDPGRSFIVALSP